MNMGKKAKRDSNTSGEVILCVQGYWEERYCGRRMFKDESDKLRNWTNATLERKVNKILFRKMLLVRRYNGS